jgi:hypothetical protein
VRNERGIRAHPSRDRRGFAPGMAAANNNDIELLPGSIHGAI